VSRHEGGVMRGGKCHGKPRGEGAVEGLRATHGRK